jgi:ABC-2 type transport system ATP-binding protein
VDAKTALALAPLAVALLGFVAYCLVDIARHPVRTMPKWVWALLTLMSVPLGGILYLVLGRHRQPVAGDRPPPPSAPERPTVHPAPHGAGRTGGALAGRTLVRTTALVKRYGDHEALAGVDLAVPEGAVYGLVGPNGSGKTTLLSVLAGLRHPTAGAVEVRVPHHKVAVLPDTPTFDPWLTGWEVVDLARALSAPSLSTAATDAALARSGLTGSARRRVGGYSRGMLQRLGLAATVVGGPELLLLDEPCSALDPRGRREVLDLVADLGGETTVLFCSHILGDVQQVCDTVGVLQDGRLLFQGPLDRLLSEHLDPRWTVRLHDADAAQPVAELLTAEPWVKRAEVTGAGRVVVTGRSAEEVQARLVPALASVPGLRVVAVEPEAGDLEQVFLELTR